MASVPFDVLFDPLDSTVLPQEVDSDDAVEIGAVSNVVSTTVSMAEFRDGELIFSDEIPVTLCTEWRELKDGTHRHHEWVRVEFKVASKPSGIASGYSLVATRWPRCNAWIYQTKFKPGWKGPRDQQPRPEGNVTTFSKLLQWLEASSCDRWETRGGVLTAGLSRPTRHRLERTRDAHDKSFTLMGACADFDKCVTFLKESEKVRMLRSKTKQGTIAVGHADLAQTHTGKRAKLYEGIIEDALYFLDVAIVQALAGDVTTSRWFGRPVVDLIDEIYREHLNNLNRRENRRVRGNSSVALVPFEDSEYLDADAY